MKIQASHIIIAVLAGLLIYLSSSFPLKKRSRCSHQIYPDEENAFHFIQSIASSRPRFSVTDPFTNARLIVGDLLLLQEHFVVPGMFCYECIALKHMPMIERYADEALSLIPPDRVHETRYQQLIRDMRDLAHNMTALQEYFAEDPEGHAEHCGRVVRYMRKYLSPRYGILHRASYIA